MQTARVRVEGLSKEFRKGGQTLHVLRGIDLVLEPGEQVVILGQSGSGKSTFLHVLSTLDRPTAGHVYYDDSDVFKRSPAQLDAMRNRQVGLVFQFHHLLPDQTALRNVMMPAMIAGTPMGKAEERARAVLDRVGLSSRLLHRPGEMSGGEQQRVAIARALVQEPGLLLADEPTGNLDPATASEVFDLLIELNRSRGSTLVVVTHSHALAERFDRKLVLEQGLFREGGLPEAEA